MTKYDKLLQKFLENPQNLDVCKIIKILEKEWFVRSWWVWSHNLYEKWEFSINFPIHNNDCKNIYKKMALKEYLKMKEKEENEKNED